MFSEVCSLDPSFSSFQAARNAPPARRLGKAYGQLAAFVLRHLLLALAAAAAFGPTTARAERVTGKDIHPERELLITAPAIVDSAPATYPGSWSFGCLIEHLVGPERAGGCV